MTAFQETVRGLVRVFECDHRGRMTDGSLGARLEDATAHALGALGLGPRRVGKADGEPRPARLELDRRGDLVDGDVFHIESEARRTDGQTAVLHHRVRNSDTGRVVLAAETTLSLTGLPADPPAAAPPAAAPAARGAAVPIATYRGRVGAAECDRMRHMNVQFYLDKSTQALAQFRAALGLSGAELGDLGLAVAPVHERVLFEHEVHAADLLAIRTGVRKVDGDSIHLASVMTNLETGVVAARFETRAGCRKLADGAPAPWPAAARAEAGRRAGVDRGAFPQPPPIDGRRLPAEPRDGMVNTFRASVNPWQAGIDGMATPRFYIGCFSDAAVNLFGRIGADRQWLEANGIGTAALDYDLAYLRPLAVGTPVETRSMILETGAKAVRFGHFLVEPGGGGIATVVEAVAVLFDLERRRAIPLPDAFRARARELMAGNGDPLV